MEGRPLGFISNHCSENTLSSVGGGGMSGGGAGGVAIMMPSSPLREPVDTSSSSNTALNLSTYTAGEDAGRLALMAKEFGLSKIRPQKRQIRRHTFMPFLRNHPDNLNEDIITTTKTAKAGDEYYVPIKDKDGAPPQSTLQTTKKHPPLRFIFSGYSLWLELEQYNIDEDGLGDLDRAMIDAANEFRLGGAIPSPHVTALYGIDTIENEEETRRIFRKDVKCVLLDMAEKRKKKKKRIAHVDNSVGKLWPDLKRTGIVVDAEFDGVFTAATGAMGTMDMAWAEVSLATSPEHEDCINALHKVFYSPRSSSSSAATISSAFDDGEEKREDYVPRSNPWVPHLSLCYDNPEGFGPNLTRPAIERFMREQCPTLRNVLDDCIDTDKFSRAVTGISLWRTSGTMAEWKCLDRYEFPTVGDS